MVANLPYNITKECLLRLLPRSDVLSHLFFMLQVRSPLLLQLQLI